MAQRDGVSVFDLITTGWNRNVTRTGGGSSCGVTIPAEYADEHGIEVGDDVAIKEAEDRDGVLELHFE